MSNSQFLRALLQAVIALTISAAVLIGGLLVYPPDLSQGNKPPAASGQKEKLTIHGSELAVRLGKGIKNKDQTLQITELAEVPDDHRAIATRFISFDAYDYPLVEYKITERHPGTYVYLLWKTDEDPQKVHTMTLHWSGDKTTAINMAKVEAWTGRVTELGIDVYGDLRGQPLNVVALNPMPYSSMGLLRTIWSEWTAFEGWTQKSINYLRGTPENPVLSPTVAMMAWSGLALIFLAPGYLFFQATNTAACVSTILMPWITLDLLWQAELSRQLHETKLQFEGRTQHEKHIADIDGPLYSYLKYLMDEVLPPKKTRILLLSAEFGHSFLRLRAHFHLLPHNVYSGRYPPTTGIRDKDYILILGEVKGLNFFTEEGALKWGKNKIPFVKLIHTHSQGSLFQVSRSID